eukprot:TRINITY_DN11921_c0_g1_i1.p2 TRINITY_DN11921_c0_g1~~TRINITY_DN11921_c0_g1_i1.p2  ORF type:complete len:252 (+),score=28.22 TRINITY_DN11921_c0_g1_i1:179-934(+)
MSEDDAATWRVALNEARVCQRELYAVRHALLQRPNDTSLHVKHRETEAKLAVFQERERELFPRLGAPPALTDSEDASFRASPSPAPSRDRATDNVRAWYSATSLVSAATGWLRQARTHRQQMTDASRVLSSSARSPEDLAMLRAALVRLSNRKVLSHEDQRLQTRIAAALRERASSLHSGSATGGRSAGGSPSTSAVAAVPPPNPSTPPPEGKFTDHPSSAEALPTVAPCRARSSTHGSQGLDSALLADVA